MVYREEKKKNKKGKETDFGELLSRKRTRRKSRKKCSSSTRRRETFVGFEREGIEERGGKGRERRKGKSRIHSPKSVFSKM